MFALHDVRHSYAGSEALRVSAWQAEQGAHWLLLGPSGSGKTTLLHILAGILRPDAGSVSVAGQALAELGSAGLDRFRGRNIGIVLQRLHLIASLTVMNNLLLAQRLAGMPQDRTRAREALASVGMDSRASAYPHQLSHGQAQRVAVARAVVNRPQLLLADEPTSNLDDVHCGQALDLLEAQAHACGATLVIATHDQRIRARITRHYQLGVQP
jgi:ABC-type lipoprotein export system ATPase subunit